MTVTLLEPVVTVDEYTTNPTVDWAQDPTPHRDVPVAIEPLTSTEAVLTSGTVISRSLCYLKAGTRIEAFWRIRWDGDDYDIDGNIEKWVGARGELYRSCILKRVDG